MRYAARQPRSCEKGAVMAEPKFKVGDKVFIKFPYPYEPLRGQEGIIQEVVAPNVLCGIWRYIVKCKILGEDYNLFIKEEELSFASSPAETKSSNSLNPKDIVGSDKLPLHLWPTTASALGSLALLDGALKYGKQNFRAVGVKSSIYLDAAKRHLDAWYEGEEAAPDSGVHHLGHALACIAILVEAIAAENLNDDRAYPTHYKKWIDKLTPFVKKIKENHKDKNPKHYRKETAND